MHKSKQSPTMTRHQCVLSKTESYKFARDGGERVSARY